MNKKNKKTNIFAFIEGFLISLIAQNYTDPKDVWMYRVLIIAPLIFIAISFAYVFLFV